MLSYFKPLLLLALLSLCGVRSATGAETDTRAVRQLLEKYQGDDPALVVKAAQPLAKAGWAEAQFVLGLFLDIGAGTRIDHLSALKWLEKAAAQEHQPAKLLLAWKYKNGFGLAEADPEAAAKWLTKLQPFDEPAYQRWFAKTGAQFAPNLNRAFLWMIDHAEESSPVMMNLAEAYISPHWTVPDKDQHLQWVERAAAADESEAVEMLSVYYEAGLFVTADQEKSLALRKLAATAGRPTSQYLLGLQYEEGRSVEKNLKSAAGWYEQAAKLDHLPSLLRLIYLLRDGGPGFEPNFKDAVRWAEWGRKLGDGECTRHLADLYNRGEGVARNFPKSAELYREAAAKGQVNAMGMLGWMYHRGELGDPDYAEARRWYQQAADLGHVRSMRELGEMNDQGLGGPTDPVAAFEWYERAARSGESHAQYQLGKFLLQGRGCKADTEEAINWFRLADKNRPRDNYFPHAGAWAKLGDLNLVVEGLIAVARQETDLWLKDNLVLVMSEDRKIRPALEQKIIQLSESPDLLSAPGILPEACLAILENLPEEQNLQQHAADLFQKMLAADRPQSALQLGQYTLAGCRMPRDLERAARWAKSAAAQTPWQGTVLLAVIECESGDTQQRDAGWSIVRKYAAGADPEAILAVARHVVADTAKPDEKAWVKKYNYLVDGAAKQRGDLEFGRRFRQFMTQWPPDEDELQVKITGLLAKRRAGTDAQVQLVHSMQPEYPADLLEQKVSGSVVVNFIVNAEGRTTDISVEKSTDPRFSTSAVEAVGHWRFVPGWKKGRAVNVRVSQLLQFSPETDQPKENK